MDDTTTPQESSEQPIVEGEIVEAEVATTPATDSSADQATVLLSLEQLIKTNISSIERLKVEVKKHREMLEDAFVGDPVYQEHLKQAKEAAKQKNATRQQIAKQPGNVVLSNKIKNMASELKEKQFALSDYLLEYQRMTGANEIEDEEGELREIVNTAKAIKTKK